MKNINKELGATVRKNLRPVVMFNNKNEFLNAEGSYVYSKANIENLTSLDSDIEMQKRVMLYVDNIKNSQGYKINESIDDETLANQLEEVLAYAGGEINKAKKTRSNLGNDYGKKYEEALTKELKAWLENRISNGQWKDMFNQYQTANALLIIANSMKKELELRQKVGDKIVSALKEGDLTLIKSLEKEYRTVEQKKEIKDAILTIEAQERRKEEERLKQKKIDELNSKLANAKSTEERQAIASQISGLTGSVAKQFGIPKGLIYVGVGIAIVVGIWITIRAIRKD
jgi:hypothetical protein